MDWYHLTVFLHIGGVLLFLMAHGASASAAFGLKYERNPERIRALLDLSVWSYAGMYIGLLILLLMGIIAGFMGNHWGRGWIWAAIILFIAILVFMGVYGSLYYGKVRTAVGLQPYRRTDQVPLGEVKSSEELALLLNNNRPIMLTAVGLGGLLIILWLMVFKPF